MELAYEYMNNPEEVVADPETIMVDEIDQVLYHVGNQEKFSLLLGLLRQGEWNRLLIFANTRVGVEHLARKLRDNGFSVLGITGTVHQKKRLKIMQRFKAGEVKILIATDVASRGIHVDDIDLVVNYDLPQDSEDYVHRIGRTGRLGKAGKAITLACEKYVYHLEALEEFIGEKIKTEWAEEGLYEKAKYKPRQRKRKRAKARAGSAKPQPGKGPGKPRRKRGPRKGSKAQPKPA
jgi:ATP-dependent RNA helicase RhlB